MSAPSCQGNGKWSHARERKQHILTGHDRCRHPHSLVAEMAVKEDICYIQTVEKAEFLMSGDGIADACQ